LLLAPAEPVPLVKSEADAHCTKYMHVLREVSIKYASTR
jgi:hypothetical protein